MTAIARAFANATGQDYPVTAEGEQHRGQARMAYRLAASNAERLMFVRGLGWHTWDGTRWAVDDKDAATNCCGS